MVGYDPPSPRHGAGRTSWAPCRFGSSGDVIWREGGCIAAGHTLAAQRTGFTEAISLAGTALIANNTHLEEWSLRVVRTCANASMARPGAAHARH